MTKQELSDIMEQIQKIADMHPYKVMADRDTWNAYNEGWTDACTIINYELMALMKEAQ